MVDQLFGEHPDFTVLVFGAAALVFLGGALLVSRIREARRRRRAKIDGGGASGSFEFAAARAVPPSASPPLEIQLRDANHSLFKVLMECCQMIAQAGDGSSVGKSHALVYAADLWGSRRTALSNREIADHSYQLATHLQSFDDPRIVAIRRVLTQLGLAEQWTTSWQGGDQAGGEVTRAP